jgi:hypothetical protein
MNERKAVTRETRGEYRSPFNIVEFPSGNGPEFSNRDTINRRETVKTPGLSHSRSCHKNGNCLRTSGPSRTENNAFVRNHAGCWRYGTREEGDALNRVYRFLCPLASFFIPNKKLLRKTRAGSKTVKVYDKALKTPYRRLMESSVTEKEKAGLSARRALLNPVELQYNLNQATDNLLAAHRAKVTFSKCPTQKVSVTF